jgi:hypothetical protein
MDGIDSPGGTAPDQARTGRRLAAPTPVVQRAGGDPVYAAAIAGAILAGIRQAEELVE